MALWLTPNSEGQYTVKHVDKNGIQHELEDVESIEIRVAAGEAPRVVITFCQSVCVESLTVGEEIKVKVRGWSTNDPRLKELAAALHANFE